MQLQKKLAHPLKNRKYLGCDFVLKPIQSQHLTVGSMSTINELFSGNLLVMIVFLCNCLFDIII